MIKEYQKSVAELEKLVAAIENTSRPLEEISADVKKAVELISRCRRMLREDEDELNKILTEDEKQ